MNYKFDEKLHLHSLDGKALTGTSSVGDVLSKVLTWWASGLAVTKLGWLNSKKATEAERLASAALNQEVIRNLTPEQYLKLLDEAYKAHSVKLKDSASAGVNLHNVLERFVKAEMKCYNEFNETNKSM